jgi:diphthine-ammonia ligase
MAPPKLKIIALISGGKDSLFSILHCLANGHEVVALANLHPQILADNEQSEDIDSFMYQTVGHSIIPLYAEALGIPLFRQAITGGAINDQREYAPPGAGQDETEDLVPLLRRVVEVIPDANAISTGAILSTYQRTRVESVAIRLGLMPLSYLWQYLYLPPYTQTSLLDDMRAVGQEAKIVKVASGGLDESFLWQDVADEAVVARMRRRLRRYGGGEGGALIGEGGEFETLALDGPGLLWKKRIEIGSVEKVAGDAGSSFARLNRGKVVEKSGIVGKGMEKLRVPPLLDEEFRQVLHRLEQRPELSATDTVSTISLSTTNSWKKVVAREPGHGASNSNNGYLQLANIRSQSYSTTADQITDVVRQTILKLHDLGLKASDIVHSTILLRDMSAFTTINPIYGSLFTKPNPPSRVTISCGELMPPGLDIILSVVVNTKHEHGRRQGLHVQSRSYWAPANIGPYSQAISLPLVRDVSAEIDMNTVSEARIVYVAGQIPLVPASMEMVNVEQLLPMNDRATPADGRKRSNDFLAQSVLSLQHLWRIGRATNTTAWTGAVAFISHCPNDEALRRARIACESWLSVHDILDPKTRRQGDDTVEEELADETEEPDIWDLKNGVASLSSLSTAEKDIRPLLPDNSRIAVGSAGGATCNNVPPMFVAQVSELPRGADIEWCSTGIAAASKITYSTINHAGYLKQKCLVETSEQSQTEFLYVAFERVEELQAFMEHDENELTRTFTVYTTVLLMQDLEQRLEPMLVPCFGIWGKEGRKLKRFETLVVMRKDISIEDL